MSCEQKTYKLTEKQKKAIEAELSKDFNIELTPTPKGVIIKRVKKENITNE